MNHQEVAAKCAEFGIASVAAPSSFTPKQSANYNFRKEMLQEMIGFFLLGKPAMKIMGYKGSGKTSVVEQFHAALNYPLLSISCTPRTEAQDLIGKMMPTSEGLRFVYGPVVVAATNGCSVLLDEYNVIDPGEATGLNQLLEGGTLFIPETNEVITPAPGFRVFATCNPADQAAGFFGRNEQDSANDDRFWTIWVNYPSPEDEVPIIAGVLSQVFEDAQSSMFAEKMVDVANRIRQAFMGESSSGSALETTISTRGLVSWARGCTVFHSHPNMIHFALERAVTNTLPRGSSSKDAIHQIVKDVFGT